MLLKQPKFFDPISLNLHRTVFLMDKMADSVLREKLELTFSQFRILLSVYKNGSITPAKIAKFHDLTRPAIKRQVELLKTRSWVVIKKDQQNKKQHALLLTKLGHTKIQKALQEFNKILKPIYKNLKPGEQKALIRLLEKLVSHIHNKFLFTKN